MVAETSTHRADCFEITKMTLLEPHLTAKVVYRQVLNVALTLLVASVVATEAAAEASQCVPNTRKMFVFGDSFADNGNRETDATFFQRPYGMTWPGYPTGRASDGQVQADYLATQALGIPSPPSYAESRNGSTSIAAGVNFAVAGSGMTGVNDLPSVVVQVDWFEAFIRRSNFSSDDLACAVVFLCVSGNDYSSFQGTDEDLKAFITDVVSLEEQTFRRLYELGTRNFMATTLGPWNCFPPQTVLTNYTACLEPGTLSPSTDAAFFVLQRHNELLENALTEIQANLSGINVLLLQQDAALAYVQNHSRSHGISQPFEPCCLGNCGVLSRTKSEYTICNDAEERMYFDTAHPTQKAWMNVVELYIREQGFTKFALTLKDWIKHLP